MSALATIDIPAVPGPELRVVPEVLDDTESCVVIPLRPQVPTQMTPGVSCAAVAPLPPQHVGVGMAVFMAAFAAVLLVGTVAVVLAFLAI